MNPIINVQALKFRYPRSEADTIRDISFDIGEGEIFGFLGPSGSGKSTTQKLLIGLLKNYQGQLSILGRDAGDWNHELYQHIGVGFELPNHFSKLSGLENLQLFQSFYGGASNSTRTMSAMELLEIVGLEDSAKKRVSQYSKGMKMRLNFARALLNNPQLLFLDEPTAGLDPVTARKIKDSIKDLQRQGKTIFLTTHNMHDADELCDRVAFIVDGKLALIDSPSSLKQQHGQKVVRVETESADGSDSPGEEFKLEGLGTNDEFLALIQTAKVRSIHTLEATLEEVFIKTTGARLL